MKKILSIICLMLLMSCSTTTEILRGDDIIWTVKSKDDAIVSYKKGDEEFVVDLRGRPSFMETAFGTIFMKTDINVGNRD